jgi:CheY-like chemotaxis protein
MDLQMPIMDGFEASKQILEQQRLNKPNDIKDICDIVALTS